MANPYRHIFRHPGTKAFVAASLIARVTLSMTAIGIITMLSEQGRSYWLSGAVMAAFTLSMALLSPQISRAVDRFGQSKVLPYMAVISSTSLLLLLVCSHYQAPVWSLFIFAILAGCMPSMSAMARARWTAIYRGTPHLHTAFSFESVMDEVCFILGPPISVGLSVSLFPEAGPLLAALLLMLGVTLFVRQKATEPPVYPHPHGHRRSVITLLPMQLLVLALIGLGTSVGAIDVISVAFAKLLGEPAKASIVLICYGLGSCIMGWVMDVLGINAGFWVIIAAGMAILLVAAIAYSPLSRMARNSSH